MFRSKCVGIIGKCFLSAILLLILSGCEDKKRFDMEITFDPKDGQSDVPIDKEITVRTNLTIYTLDEVWLNHGNAHELFVLSKKGSGVDYIDGNSLIAVDYGPGVYPYNRIFDREHRPHTFFIRPPKSGMNEDGFPTYRWTAGEYTLTMDNFQDAWGQRYGPISVSFRIVD